jgi:hypothetical protein
MRTIKSFLIACVVCVLAAVSGAQSSAAQKPAQISFTFDFPGSTPDHYTLTLDSSGRGTYVSGRAAAPKSKDAAKSDADSSSDADSDTTSDSQTPYTYQFSLSDATRARIFDLARRANYFKGDLDYGKGKIASTGVKTLIYKDGLRSTEATYNYSNKAPVQELTNLLQGMAATLEFGRRLDYLHHYQKLALDEELKRMEEMAKADQLAEVQAIAPILKHIADDATVMNVSRARAERLLSKAGGNSSAK